MSKGSPTSNGPIIAAVDFSPYSHAALAWAANAAHRFGAPLLVLHVVHDPGAAPGSYVTADEEQAQRMEDVAVEMLEQFVSEVRKECPLVGEPQQVLAVGLPATRILEVAEREGAQLIVVGSRGRTGLSHMILGSKAQRVAQLSSIPVTIVKAEEATED